MERTMRSDLRSSSSRDRVRSTERTAKPRRSIQSGSNDIPIPIVETEPRAIDPRDLRADPGQDAGIHAR